MMRTRRLLACLAGLCALSAAVAEAQPRAVETVDGKDGRLQVLEWKGLRILTCDEVIQGAVPIEEISLSPKMLIRSGDYVGLIPYLRPVAKSALVLGLGAGVHDRVLRAVGMEVHNVDIDPAVVTLARKHFGFDGNISVADARAFLDQTQRRFDAIVLDTFAGGEIPEHLYTREAFERVAKRLAPRGALVVHLIAEPDHPATGAVARTLAEVFPRVVAFKAGRGGGIQHLYLFAGPDPLELSSKQRLELDAYGFTGEKTFEPDTAGAPILTDAQNTLNELSRGLAAEHRRRCRQFLER